MVDGVKQANWQYAGGTNIPGDGPAYKATFGPEIGAVVSFLDRITRGGGGHGSANFLNEKGFVIISRATLNGLGVSIDPSSRENRFGSGSGKTVDLW